MSRRLAATLALCPILLATPAPTRAADPEPPPLPSLVEPASDLQLPGKFVWADLFTNDLPAAREFYAGVFGWEWRWVSEQAPRLYGLFYAQGQPVAGVAHIDPPQVEGRYARWIHYASARDVGAVADVVANAGGRTLLPPRRFARRGELAVFADPEGALFGALASSSGDPEDYRAELGEWLWIGLAASDPEAESRWYASSFGYEVRAADPDAPAALRYVLESDGYARAGIGRLPPESPSRPTWLGFVRVASVPETLARARALGARVLRESTGSGGSGDYAIVSDPLGGSVGLMQWSFDEPDAGETGGAP